MRIKGFSVVELLLGLAIAAIIGVTITNMFWSATKLDDKLRHAHGNYMGVLMADRALTHDLENAVSLDFSNNYPDAVIFDGQTTNLSFLTQTPTGIKRVRYSLKRHLKGHLPVEYLVRQESRLADWLNSTSSGTIDQTFSSVLKNESFNCRYAPKKPANDAAIVYQDSWEDKELPLAVSCTFILYDSKNPQEGPMFKRDIFLPFQNGQ